MNYNEIANELIHDAELNASMDQPNAAIIDIKENELEIEANYNEFINAVTSKGYKCSKIENAPYPFCLFQLKGKLIIYKL